MEIERLDRRWQQLPLDQALDAFPTLMTLIQRIAEATAWPREATVGRRQLPDLGPAMVINQLKTVVFDYQLQGLDIAWLADRLVAVRREIR